MMTKGEREELAKLVRERAKLGKTMAAERAAELLADAEEQLATIYEGDDERWADITAQAAAVARKAQADLVERCDKAGIPKQFRPSLSIGWSGRGQNGDKERRVELRRVLQTRVAAMQAKAITRIEVAKVEALTEIARDALESAAAVAFLEAMPTPAQLMPTLDRAELKLLLDETKVPDRYLGYYGAA